MGIAPPKHLNWYCKRCKSAFHTHRKDPKCPKCGAEAAYFCRSIRDTSKIACLCGRCENRWDIEPIPMTSPQNHTV